MSTLLGLSDLQHIRGWMSGHKTHHPVEYETWDALMTVFMLGAIGWLPALLLGALGWALAPCGLAVAAPTLYARWRAWAHRHGRLRCDWLVALPSARIGR